MPSLAIAAILCFSPQSAECLNTPFYVNQTQGTLQLMGSNSGEMLRGFITESQMLSNPIDTTTSTEEDNERVDQEVNNYKALADRIADGRYDALPKQQRDSMLQGINMFYQGAARSTDREIETAQGMIANTERADAAYNFLIVHEAYLYAGAKLFPDNPEISAAREKVKSAIAKLGGSRASAQDAADAAALENARNVRMPAAVTQDKGVQALFRKAWRTSGISWEIMQINVKSGWRDKLEYGRVIGQRRDAAIAARDPNNAKRCNLYDFTLFRDKSGDVRRDSHNTTRIACENVR